MGKASSTCVALEHLSSGSRVVVASVTLMSVAWWPCAAFADDPCEAPTAEVKRLVGELNNATAGNRKAGTFHVERAKGADRFRTTFLIEGKPVYTGQLVQRSDVSDALDIRVSRKLADALEISYVSGGSGAIRCNYRISRTSDRFIASKTK